MAGGTVILEGEEAVVSELLRLASRYNNEAKDALYQQAGVVMNESKRECPVLTGRLRSSGEVTEPTVTGDTMSTKLGYSADYAVFVHENQQASHKAPTKAKFLEDPMNRHAGSFLADMHRRLKGMVR